MADDVLRQVLPIPDRAYVGLTTYDAKDPDTALPADPRHPAAEGGAERPGRPARRRGIRRQQRVRRARQHADRREAGGQWPQVQPLPHDRALLADPGSAAERTQPPLGRHGRHHRDRDLGARLQLAPSEHRRATGRDAQAQRLLDRAVREVPRGPGLADQPDGSVRQLALRWRRLRILLRVHRRRDEPVRPGDLPQHDARSSPIGPPRRATTSPRT